MSAPHTGRRPGNRAETLIVERLLKAVDPTDPNASLNALCAVMSSMTAIAAAYYGIGFDEARKAVLSVLSGNLDTAAEEARKAGVR